MFALPVASCTKQSAARQTSVIPGSGSGYGNGGVRGVENLRHRFRCQPRRLVLSIYNACTLSTDGKVIELEEVMSKLRWDITAFSEVRQEGQDSIILESGTLFYYLGGDHQSQGGIGYIVQKSLMASFVCLHSLAVLSITYISIWTLNLPRIYLVVFPAKVPGKANKHTITCDAASHPLSLRALMTRPHIGLQSQHANELQYFVYKVYFCKDEIYRYLFLKLHFFWRKKDESKFIRCARTLPQKTDTLKLAIVNIFGK
ncbi:jg743 [Pararge aegeria aegeria]|uniref:Jg743 protein n=1 Tax=Pararge aegeria aegeria TaxID=348720 RepID=A0A8S4S485_9NEOP|nr:jg743 [Pararge aegeria aegeria]